MKDSTVSKVSGTEQLQALFRQAQVEKTPVSLYRKPQSGEIALDFSDWKDVEVFDLDNMMVIVPPGILLKELNALATENGLRFIPADTPAFAQLSVGEWAYRGCPNPLSWKYSAGKHFLLGANYVLPNGDVTPVGGKCIKNVTGYDFTRFLTGPYADLAVGIRFIIKLMPQPVCRQRYDVTVPSLDAAVELVNQLQGRSVPPSWLFWTDSTAGSKLFNQMQQGQRLLFELDGNEAEVQDAAADVAGFLTSCQSVSSTQAADMPDLSFLESGSDGFWLLDEFKVPCSAIQAFAAKFAELQAQTGIKGGLFGQLADGKIHLYLEQTASANASFIAALQTAASALGGAASGKYNRLYEHANHGPLSVLEDHFKQRIDPERIFNQREVAR